MLNGAVDFHRQVSDALQDPVRRDAILATLDRGTPVTVSTALDEYDTQSCSYKRPKTIANDRNRLDAFFAVVPLRFVNDLTTKAVNSYFAARTAKGRFSSTTLLRFRETLHAFYEFARKNGYVKINPVSNVPRPRIHDRDIRFLDLRQIEVAIAAVAGTPFEPVVATAIYAGLRREEICWLTTEDIDLTKDRPLLRVRSKTVDGEFWLPKNKKNRTVPISKALYPYLARQSLKTGKKLWFFPSSTGCRWDPDNLSHHLTPLLDRRNLAWNFLDFRHTFGSQLAQKGVSLFKISELMGNSPEIARRHYARLMPENMHAEVEFPSPAPHEQTASAAP
jgi:integrase